MLVGSSDNILAILPVVSDKCSPNSLYFYNIADKSFQGVVVPQNAVACAKVCKVKYTAPKESKEILDSTEEIKVGNTVRQPSTMVRHVAFTKDGKYAAVVTDGHIVIIYEVATGEIVTYCPTSRKGTVIAFSPEDKHILFGDRVGGVYAVSFAKLLVGEPVEARSIIAHLSVITHLAFITLDGKDYLVTGDQEHQLRLSNYPTFFDIERVYLGIKCCVIGADMVNENKQILVAHGITPEIMRLDKNDKLVTGYFENTAIVIKQYSTITGHVDAEVKVVSTVPAVEERSIAHAIASGIIGTTAYYLPVNTSVDRINGKYKYNTTNNTYGQLKDIIVVKTTPTSLETCVLTNVSDITDPIYSIVCKEDNLYAMSRTKLYTVKITDSNVGTVINTADLPETAPLDAALIPTVAVELVGREIEGYVKHEVLFTQVQERKEAKRVKRASGMVVSDSEDDDEE